MPLPSSSSLESYEPPLFARQVLAIGAYQEVDILLIGAHDVAAELGVSRERVPQIEAQALRKCARWARKHGYRLEDLLAG